MGHILLISQIAKQRGFLFITSGAIFLSGALGIEIFAAALIQFGFDNMYPLTVIAEEFCEMLGVTLFIYALASHLSSTVSGIQISFGN